MTATMKQGMTLIQVASQTIAKAERKGVSPGRASRKKLQNCYQKNLDF